ncbi:universal stress protein [bacterium]|nr:universal stress protein [candidate division CSSED10-310 bacterium]
MNQDIQRILCATDFSESARYAYQFALSIAARHHASIELFHVMEPSAYSSDRIESDEETYAQKMSHRLVDFSQSIPSDISISTLIAVGVPYIEIVKRAELIHADLIVIGTHGRTGIRHMLIGSVAEKVVRTASCPVMTVRHPDHAVSESTS